MRKSSVCKEWVVYFAVALCCQLEVLHSFFAFSGNVALLLLRGLFWILYKEKLVRHIIYLLNMYLRLYGRDGRAGLIWLPIAGGLCMQMRWHDVNDRPLARGSLRLYL